MRLAILGIRGIPAKYGGFETFAEELAVRLVQYGVDVTVFVNFRLNIKLLNIKASNFVTYLYFN